MNRTHKALLVALFASVLTLPLVACTNTGNQIRKVLIEKEISLPPALAETSGLYCPSNKKVYSINDSGNTPVIYSLSTEGVIVNEQLIGAKNNDWEAITGDNRFFYIGDIGNNAGKRQDINVIKLDKATNQSSVLKISYSNNKIENNEHIRHDFDAEALVITNQNLYLFSKSWQSNKLYIYKVDTNIQEQVLHPIASTEGLPGVVTGVDFNKATNEYIVVGYSVNLLRVFTPFIAVLNNKFELTDTIAPQGFQQIEGICISPNGTIWISQERSFLQGAKLFKVQLTK
jgi:uncharacterized protein YjiK